MTRMFMARLAVPLLACLVLVGACSRPVQPGAVARQPAGTVSGARLSIDPVSSTLRIFVRRGGTLAALGHNHVLVAHGVAGEIGMPEDARRVNGQFAFGVADLGIDDPEERAAAGPEFAGVIDAAAIAGTRHNLLGPDVLDAAQAPQVTVEFAGASGGPDDYVVAASFIVRGVRSVAQVPVHVVREATGIRADGEVLLSQLSLGLTPFSVMLGALKVEDRLLVRFHLVAHQAG